MCDIFVCFPGRFCWASHIQFVSVWFLFPKMHMKENELFLFKYQKVYKTLKKQFFTKNKFENQSGSITLNYIYITGQIGGGSHLCGS